METLFGGLLDFFGRISTNDLKIYCPDCQNELVRNGHFIYKEGETVCYQCSVCDLVTYWNIDGTVPTRLTEKELGHDPDLDHFLLWGPYA